MLNMLRDRIRVTIYDWRIHRLQLRCLHNLLPATWDYGDGEPWLHYYHCKHCGAVFNDANHAPFVKEGP